MVQLSNENRQETLFYFEAIGFLLLIFCAVIIAKLGTLGFYLTIFFKILFGDWYLLFVFILLIIGLSNILNHKSINKAIDKCSKDGGGRVVIPAGIWHTGPITLKSNVNNSTFNLF